MQDDLIGLLLGCKCSGKCCCPEKEAPAPKANMLFRQQKRTLPPPALLGESPLIVPVQSYDSPQRSGHWGAGFIPAVTPVPPAPPRTFTHANLGGARAAPPMTPSFPLEFQENSGGTVGLLPTGPLRVTPGRAAVSLSIIRRTLYPAGFAFALDPYGPFNQGEYHPRGDIRATPLELSPFGALPAIGIPQSGTSQPIVLNMIRYRLGAEQTLAEWFPVPSRQFSLGGGEEYPAFDAIGARWAEKLIGGFAPLNQGAEVVIERRGPLKLGVLRAGGGDDSTDVGALEVYREDTPQGVRYWTLALQNDVLEDGTPAPALTPPEALWKAGAVLQIRTNGDPFPWGEYSCSGLNTMPSVFAPEPDFPWAERRWQSPGGLIQFLQGDGSGPDTLSAYGVSRTGGTWAGVRGPITPQRLEYWASGEDDPGEAVVLHEKGAAVTAIWPNGTVETCTRAAFESDVLRCPAGAFQGFSRVGLGSNVWPPQWAWAVTGTDAARAVVAWDIWRDSVKGQAGRSRKRPDPGGVQAPTPPGLRPPLGMTLATTGRTPRHEEPLRARAPDFLWGQPPWHLPLTVEVFRDGGWEAAANARTALSKPALYPPARQLEELNDSSGVPAKTALRLSWAGPILPAGPGPAAQAALLLRAKVGTGKLPEVVVGGSPAVVWALGRNAGASGWQPFLVTWGAGYPAVHPGTITVTCSAPLSRLLLTRLGQGQAEGGGTDI